MLKHPRWLDRIRIAAPALALFGALLLSPVTVSAQQAPTAEPDALADMQALVTLVRGPVEVLTPDARPVQEGERLTRGLRVRTGAGGKASLQLANGATLELEENSLLTLFASPAPAAPGAAPSTTTTLSRGTLRVRAAPAGLRASPIAVQTEATTVWAGRADAMIAADVGGHITRLAVWRGRMRVRVGTREYLLTQGYGVMEEAGRPPGVLRLLPRAPVWRAAPPDRLLSFGEPIDVSAGWSPSPHAEVGFPAAEWKVQVARDASFRDMVENTFVPAHTTSWTGRRYPPGTWYMRVFAVDVNRFESTASPVVRIEIAAPMVIPAADNPDARRAAVRVPRGFYCGLDGSSLTSSDTQLQLAPGRAHRLRCALNPHGRDAREHLIAAGLSGPMRRELRVDPPAADTLGGAATGVLSLRLHDAAGEPVSLAVVDAQGSDGVTVDPIRETEQRGVYTATVHWPAGVRACRLRFTVNEALQFDHDARVERVQVVPAAAARTELRHDPSVVHVDVMRVAPPRDPEDDEPINPEE